MDKAQLTSALANYLPEQALSICAEWIMEHRVSLMITPDRLSKRGDYRSPRPPYGHRISINGTLNPYSFLITFTHEIAHLRVWEAHKNKVKPHGYAWKTAFQILMRNFQGKGIFPPDLEEALASYMRNPMASTVRDHHLYRCLCRYDAPEDQQQKKLFLEDIPLNGLFKLIDRPQVFRKIRRLRTYYLCAAVEGHREYRINALAEVTVVKDV